MTFKYGAGVSLYAEAKQHREEQQWSPAVFYDRPRCILCYRCIRMCGEGMDVWALGVQNRAVSSVIVPMAATSSIASSAACALTCAPWARSPAQLPLQNPSLGNEPCLHRLHALRRRLQGTLGVRQSNDGSEIVRADNRDKSGINGDFLCAKAVSALTC